MAQLSILLAKPANFNQNNLSNCTLLAWGTWSVSKPVAADQVSGVDLPFFMMLLTQQAPGLDHYPDHLAPHALKLTPSHTFTCRSPWNLVIPSLLCLLFELYYLQVHDLHYCVAADQEPMEPGHP